MRGLLALTVTGLLAAHGAMAQAPASLGGTAAHARATLHPVAGAPGRTTLLLTLSVESGWHVSYRNPGETGLSTRLVWSLPAGVSVAREVWPVPVITRTDVGVTHTLEGEVPWLIEFDGPRSSEDRLVSLTLRYGVCRDVCIPAQLTVQGVLPGAASAPAPAVPERVRARLVRDGGTLVARRVAPGVACVADSPFHDAGALPAVLPDTTLALPLTVSRGTRPIDVHGLFMKSPDTLVVRQGARFLFVRGSEGVTARLDFSRTAPGCRSR